MESILDRLGSPRFVVAPMVDASELPWRLLCRRHGAELCYTPMLHSKMFSRDPKYRKDGLASCLEDRPLVVQFCGNDPKTLLSAALLAEDHCDAIDINLGCPQAIAKRGRYGAFLQDDWPLLKDIVSTLRKSVRVPITCKVRVYNDVERTVQYALMLEASGCNLITVHGRTKEQKGPLTGIANWKHIKAVREAVKIPVFANGNIQCLNDVLRCLAETGVDGVMSAEGILTNPALFEGSSPPVWEMAEEYLSYVAKYPCPNAFTRGHLFKLFHALLGKKENSDQRQTLAGAQNIDDFIRVVSEIKEKYLPYHTAEKIYYESNDVPCFNLSLPPWICQPYVRMSPDLHKIKLEEINIKVTNSDENSKRAHEDPDGNVMSKKKMKKLRRMSLRPQKGDQIQRAGDICEMDKCPNPLGGKCTYKFCKQCCRNKCFLENLDCPGHRILVQTRRKMAAYFSNRDVKNDNTEPNLQVNYAVNQCL